MLKADAGTLAAAISRVTPVVERRNTIQILSCARLRVEAGTLKVSASNLDVQIDSEATVQSLGGSAQAAVGARRLFAILRQLPRRDSVELISEEQRLVINWNGGRAVLPALPPSDFPDLELGDGPFSEGAIDGQIRDALTRCWPFISTEETRYYLNGVCLWGGDGQSKLVATDSRRLAAIPGGDSLDAIMAGMGNRKPIVPRDTVAMWLGLPVSLDLRMKLRQDALKLELRADGYRLASKMIDGDYPPWERVVPDTREMRALTVPRTALINALGLMLASLPPMTANGLIVVENGRLQLQSKTHEGDIAVDVGPAGGKPFEYGVNPRLLLRSVAATRGATITIWVGDRASPIRLEGSDAKPGEAFVVMGLRSATRPSFSAPPLAEAA